jgi:hypothetical protein
VSANGTGPNPGVADWFEVTFTTDTLTLSGSISGESGILYDVYYDCAGDAVGNDTGMFVGSEQAQIGTGGTYYIKVYPEATGSSSGGTFSITASVS